MYCNVFLYPDQTFHVPTRKFFENEVFRSTQFRDLPLDDIAGRCCVLFARDFTKGAAACVRACVRARTPVRGRRRVRPHTRRPATGYCSGMPEGFAPDDVYVCESRYRDNGRDIIPIKSWITCMPTEFAATGKLHPPLTLCVLQCYPLPAFSAFWRAHAGLTSSSLVPSQATAAAAAHRALHLRGDGSWTLIRDPGGQIHQLAQAQTHTRQVRKARLSVEYAPLAPYTPRRNTRRLGPPKTQGQHRRRRRFGRLDPRDCAAHQGHAANRQRTRLVHPRHFRRRPQHGRR